MNGRRGTKFNFLVSGLSFRSLAVFAVDERSRINRRRTFGNAADTLAPMYTIVYTYTTVYEVFFFFCSKHIAHRVVVRVILYEPAAKHNRIVILSATIGFAIIISVGGVFCLCARNILQTAPVRNRSK